jgi:hypothetical protein
MIGAMIAPPLVIYLATRVGYRWAFLMRALRERKISHPGVLLRYRQTWAVMACRLRVSLVAQFYWYWIFDYLVTIRGFSSFAVYYAPNAAGCSMMIAVALFGHPFLSANMIAAVPDMFPATSVGRVRGLHGICGGLSGGGQDRRGAREIVRDEFRVVK